MVSHVGARIDVAVVTALSRFFSRSGLASPAIFFRYVIWWSRVPDVRRYLIKILQRSVLISSLAILECSFPTSYMLYVKGLLILSETNKMRRSEESFGSTFYASGITLALLVFTDQEGMLNTPSGEVRTLIIPCICGRSSSNSYSSRHN